MDGHHSTHRRHGRRRSSAPLTAVVERRPQGVVADVQARHGIAGPCVVSGSAGCTAIRSLHYFCPLGGWRGVGGHAGGRGSMQGGCRSANAKPDQRWHPVRENSCAEHTRCTASALWQSDKELEVT